MLEAEVWRGKHGDPVPPFGPLTGLLDGDTLAYEFELPERFVPRPGFSRLERTFVLLDLQVSEHDPARDPSSTWSLGPPVTAR